MKFYMVWDKEHEQYVTTRRYIGRSSQNPRVYTTHRHAASAAMGFLPNQPYLDTEDRRRLRQEHYEIHEYESNGFIVVS